MGGAQLKQLKERLQNAGLTGQKKGGFPKNRKARIETANLLREALNPFDVKITKSKREIVGRDQYIISGRPGEKKQEREALRRAAYREEVANRNNVGRLHDRRFGENDTSLTTEEKMLARFTKEHQSRIVRQSIFDIDNDINEDIDIDEDDQDLGLFSRNTEHPSKHADEFEDYSEDTHSAGEDDEPRAKRSKHEIMQEVIAKSKMKKMERQNIREEDRALTEKLDDKLDELYSAFYDPTEGTGSRTAQNTKNNDDDYDRRLKELAFDRRSRPTDRTKTKEELEKERDDRLKKIEEAKQRRMNDFDIESGGEEDRNPDVGSDDDDEALAFGLSRKKDVEPSDSEGEQTNEVRKSATEAHSKVLKSYPRTKDEMIAFFKKKNSIKDATDEVLKEKHPSKKAGNKDELTAFATALADYSVYTEVTSDELDSCIKSLLRILEWGSLDFSKHIRRSLFDCEARLKANGFTGLENSDLKLFMIVGLIYPTSDQYHLVCTPATLIMAEYFNYAELESERAIFNGLVTLKIFLSYQRSSKRYSPEVPLFLWRNFTLLYPEGFTLNSAKTEIFTTEEHTHMRVSPKRLKSTRLEAIALHSLEKSTKSDHKEQLFLRLLEIILSYARLWSEMSSFPEIFGNFLTYIHNIKELNPYINEVDEKLSRLMNSASKGRRPLTLQSHKPIPIASYTPKFEDNYNPDKHYDPDVARKEVNKLKAELKKERKGALRDIRRDAEFVSREKLADKKRADEEYHRKLARIERSVATEEGAEKNKYERENRRRK